MKQALKKNLCAAVGAVLGVGACALLSAPFADVRTPYYTSLQKPPFTPTPVAFAGAWAMMFAVLAFVLMRQLLAKNEGALWGMAVMLTLTALWSYAFFERQNTLGALMLLVLLMLAVVFTMRRMRAADGLSAALLLIFLAWLSFMAVLNYYVEMMN